MSGGAVLALDTTLDACSVAVASGGEVRAARSETMDRGQAERLAPMAREVMSLAGLAFADLERVAVTRGPGSFTGVRVGLSFARALALALDRPCVGVATLEALALQQGEAGLRAAAIETPGAAYLAMYEDGRPLIAPTPIERGAHRRLIEAASGGRPYALTGPGATVDVGALALRAPRLESDAYRPDPLYLRAPHVTLPTAPS